MIHIKRSYPEPEALAQERGKRNGNYRHKDISEELQKLFYGRCYLCEDTPQSINIEHLVPHRDNNHALKFSWDNLFWSCAHCNNIKLARYESILDCTKDPHIERKFIYKFDPFPTEEIEIIPTEYPPTKSVLETQKLLTEIFNGTSVLKTLESNSLRRRIAENFVDLTTIILKVTDPATGEKQKKALLLDLDSELSERALFASLKRGYVRRHPKLHAQLKELIPDLNL